ncbi:MAG: formyltransferase family protein [Pseudomonadota bacterium]
MKTIILTGDETRHQFFRQRIAADPRITVLATYCEGVEKSLEKRTQANPAASALEMLHVLARTQAEKDFFGDALRFGQDHSNPRRIAKGAINDDEIVQDIIALKPELLVCYGASLVRSELLKRFEGRFLNVHLGLSPYYRGSGTNIWPLINGEPGMVGATFMHINEGIDTGEIIHQIRADIFLGDSPHSIGNRLIAKMTDTYADLIARFPDLTREAQPQAEGTLYYQKDYDAAACQRLYDQFSDNLILRHLTDPAPLPDLVENAGLRR